MIREFDVLIAGYYGFGNLGDELLLESAVGLLTESGIEPGRIAVLSANPEETSDKLGIRSFDRWNPREAARAMKSSRSLLLGGGGLFQDSTSSRSCIYYWGIVKMARLFGARFWALGQSVGPFKTALGRRLAKSAFSSSVYTGVRDEASLAVLERWKLSASLAPDLVMNLKVELTRNSSGPMLLNLRPWPGDIGERTARAAAKFAAENKIEIVGVALSEEDAREIKRFESEKIISLHKITLVKSIKDLENSVDGASRAFGMRLHFLVLSFLAGLPCCAASYDRKVASFAADRDIPVLGTNDESINFSKPADKSLFEKERARICEVFKEGFAAVEGEIKWSS